MSRMGLLLAGMAVFSLVACTANGDSADASPTYHHGGNASEDKSSDSKATSSSSTDSDSSDYSIQDLVEMVSVPAVAYSRGTVEYRVDAFAIGKTEVTQGLYRKVMGAISKDDDLGDNFPVEFTVKNYRAPYRRNENGTINPDRSKATDIVSNNFRLTSAQWFDCLYKIRTHMRRFEDIWAKKQFDEAETADRFNRTNANAG